MRRKINKNWSVNPVDLGFHLCGIQYSISNASNQSAEYEYKRNEEVPKECIVNAVDMISTTKQETSLQEQERWEDYLTSKFMRLRMILGRSPELVELYNAGFTHEEIGLMESLTDWMYESDGLEEWRAPDVPKLW